MSRPFVLTPLAAFLLAASVLACHRRPEEPLAAATTHLAPTPVPTPVLAPDPSAAATALPAAPPLASATASADSLRFAVIGDYGAAGDAERRVAELVKAFHPAIVITTGDNNYPRGGADTIDANIGQYYAEFIGSYRGKYGPGASENRFFPSLGNHDWYERDAAAYFDYFTLPGNERYYAFQRGPVEFFALDSDAKEPDGITATSKQAQWLKAAATASKAPWQIAYMHHPPYSSGPHGSLSDTQWPFRDWGIDLVLAGHDHTYERIVVGGLTYLVNGLGGNHEYEFKKEAEGSLFRYQEKHGAQLCEATAKELRLTFINVEGTRIDEVVLTR